MAHARVEPSGLPAVGYGPRVTQSYGELAERAARLASALRAARAASPATASRSSRRTASNMSRRSTASGTAASPRCRPTPSCTGASLATFSNIPARACASRRRASTSEVAPHAPASLERLIVIGSEEYHALFAADPIAGRAARRQRSRLAVLYLRHHRPAEGRDAHPSRCWRRRALRISPKSTRPRRATPSCTPRR